MTPSVPTGEDLNYCDEEYASMEALGIEVRGLRSSGVQLDLDSSEEMLQLQEAQQLAADSVSAPANACGCAGEHPCTPVNDAQCSRARACGRA